LRFALIGDIHANLSALEAALGFCDEAGVDGYLCTGDLVGYGPEPNECVLRMAALPGLCVAGNHDLIALERLTTDRCVALARRSLEWTRRVLGEEARRILQSLPATATAEGGVLIAHGSVSDPEEYVRTAAQARDQLETASQARIVVLGHTHVPSIGGSRRPWLTGATGEVELARDERYVLNPGSVGQSRQRLPRVRLAILDLERSSVSFHALRYDTGACRAALRRQGLPARSYHLPPRRLRALAARAIPWRPGRKR